jgi:outer membrane lipoprotein-sorting protein
VHARVFILVVIVGVSTRCNFKLPDLSVCINLSKRSPAPVGAEVDKILTDWQTRRANSKSFYAKIKRTFRDTAFKTEKVSDGVMRYRHPDLGRLDFLAGKDGKGREIFLVIKNHEFWHIMAGERRIEILEFDDDSMKSAVFEFMRSSPFVWFVPTDKTTLQKHGVIKLVKDEGSTIELRVDLVERADEHENGYESMIVSLRKPDLLPTKMIIKENADVTVIYEFTDVAENVDINETDFNPPKLDLSNWRVTRQRLLSKNPTANPRLEKGK